MIAKEQLRTLLPHADAMCLLDAVEEWSAESITCTTRSHLSVENPLRRDGRLAALHAIEYAAQAMAIHGALSAGSEGSAARRQGFLGSVRDTLLHVDRLDDLLGQLTVRATRLLANQDGLIYNFSVTCGEQPLCDGRIVVALK